MNQTDASPSNNTVAALCDPVALRARRTMVLGLGESGLAMVRYLVHCGASVTVADTRAQPPRLPELDARFAQVARRFGALDDLSLDDLDLICWSPGVSVETGAGGRLYQRALAAGITVAGELDLFVAALTAAGAPADATRIIAVTGTNGKTTVTELAAMFAQAAGERAQAAGNIGPAMLDAWCDAMQAGVLPALWVLELSSFQLALAHNFSPSAGALLNISQDHLDWHQSMETYGAAKRRVVGADSVGVSLRSQSETMLDHCAQQRTIGLNEPQQVGDMGIVHEGGISWLAWAIAAQATIPGKRRREQIPTLVRRLMPADALRLRGAHNQLNVLAALALCTAVGIDMARMLHSLRDYTGAPHRCQLLTVIDDVEYYNDSKGTNVGATVAALTGLGKSSWLIAGGQGKSQDFSLLREAVARHAAGVILIGEDAQAIAAALADTGVELVHADTLPDAVALAAGKASSGQAVLLSPACASFDMFDNYQHRGQVFCAAVQALALERGATLEVPC